MPAAENPPAPAAAPAPAPVAETPAQAAPQPSAESSLAAAASSAFGTLPPKPARVLEDSFNASPAPAPAEAQPAPQPQETASAPPPPAELPEPAMPMEPPPAPEPQAAAPEPQKPQTAPPVETRPQQPAPAPSQPEHNPLKRQVGKGKSGRRPQLPSRQQPAPAQPRQSAPAQEAPNLDEYQPAQAAPAAAEKTQPRGRLKQPRNFAAATIEAPKPQASMAEGAARLAEVIPVDTRPLDRVDEELIKSGIIAGPEADALTSGVPVSLAAAEMPYTPAAEPAEPQTPFAPPPQPEAAAPQPKPHPESESRPQPATPAALPMQIGVTEKPRQPEAPLPEPQSSLPWANPAAEQNDWEVDLPPSPPPPPAQPAAPGTDFFRPESGRPAPESPPWVSAQASTSVPPPELHSAGNALPTFARGNTPVWSLALVAAAAGVVALLIWSNTGQEVEIQEKVARWTGSLSEHTENLPPEMGGVAQTDGTGNLVKPESTFSMADLGQQGFTPTALTTPPGTLLPPPAPGAAGQPATQVDFAGAEAPTPAQTITADGTEAMPEDVSLFAKLQKAVDSARAQQQAEGTGTQAAMPQQPAAQGELTPEQLEAELAAYRKSLTDAGTSQATVQTTPQKFLKDPDAYMDGTPATQQAAGQQGLLPPPDLYANNPANLPIVGEPLASAPARVRSLDDFEAETAPFEPERNRVRIPRNVKPRMAATDFPMLQVLSFVPNRGVIAYANGREGVLLIGESLEGWQLTKVTGEVAEFRVGNRRHFVTAND